MSSNFEWPPTPAKIRAEAAANARGIPWDSLSVYEQMDLINEAYDADMIERGLDPLVDD